MAASIAHAGAGAGRRGLLQGQDRHLHRRDRGRRRLRPLWTTGRRVHAALPARLDLRGAQPAGRRPSGRNQHDLRLARRRPDHRHLQHRPDLQPARRAARHQVRPHQDVLDRQGHHRAARDRDRAAVADQDLRRVAGQQGAAQFRDLGRRQRELCRDHDADRGAQAACEDPDRLQRQRRPARDAPRRDRRHDRLALLVRAVREERLRPLSSRRSAARTPTCRSFAIWSRIRRRCR